MTTRSLILAAILATAGTPLVAAASPANHDPAYVYAPLSSWQAIHGGMNAEPADRDAGVATSYPLASYASASSKAVRSSKYDSNPRNGDTKETTYALSSYPTADRG